MDMPAQQHFNTSEANVDDRFLIKNADLPGVKIHEHELVESQNDWNRI